jgi:GH15 family glucan-1,4-alpha-glucosidase
MATGAGIGDYGLLSDCQGSALVSRSGSVDWMCVPRFDSPSVFAALLDGDAGHWRIGPVEDANVERAYVTDTMVLRTVFETRSGRVALSDAMSLAPSERGHGIGKRSLHALIRRVEGLDGEVEMEFDLAPRPEYGLTVPVMVPTSGGLVTRGGPFSYVLCTDVSLDVGSGRARGRLVVRAGDVHHFALRAVSPWSSAPTVWPGPTIAGLFDGTVAGWRSWSGLHQRYDGPYAELVRHSGRVLQALTYAPTGAVVAAPTTSLPETMGGERNWDYRFCWVRDASLTLEALWVAACPDEAGEFFRFLATSAGGQAAVGHKIQILYGVGGERLVPEHELDHLGGFGQSRPVRIGNGAWKQVQLDVFGELLNAAWVLASQVGTFDAATASFLVDMADTAASHWTDADQGIWEVRGGPRHFVYSKLMCWVALDRAVRLAGLLGAEERAAGWAGTRDEIRAAIERQGWSDVAGAFGQSFDSNELDAANLMLLLTGFLTPDDPRSRATVDAIASRLTDDRGFVYRYRSDDGLAGEEGTFAICTFWLVSCLARLGEVDRARELFERVTSHANDLGLMAEEIDAGGDLLGNFPQAFTHIGLVNAAWDISMAEGSAPADVGPSILT